MNKPKTLINKSADTGLNAQHNRAEEWFPIRVLAERTSVGSSTLRAWERRYGLLKPQRTPKGHRLYSELDVHTVVKIKDLLNDGHSLPQIAELLSAVSSNQIHESTVINNSQGISSNVSENKPSSWDKLIQSTLEATSDFSIGRIDTIYNEASSLYPVDMVTERLIQPTIEILGKAWEKYPERGIAEEHFYTSWLKNRLGARFHHAYTQARGARIICACTPGSYHEIGLMLFSLSALARGYRVLYFGADLPLNQLSYITQRSAAKAVVLGASAHSHSDMTDELSALAKGLDTPVFIGGSTELINIETFESAGGILLGSNVSVALKIFERHIPAYPAANKAASKQRTQ